MELYTLDRGFHKDFVIDEFISAIWTSRYYGDSEVELVVPLSIDLLNRLKVGRFLGMVGTDELMIMETMSIEKNKLKVTGISILSWLNNRIIRHSANHEDRYWYISGQPAGQVLWTILKEMCSWQGFFPLAYYNYGIPKQYQLGIDGLAPGRYDTSGGNISVGVPYGPVYDALRDIATTYEIGMTIILTRQSDVLGDPDFPLVDYRANPTPPNIDYVHEFTSYRGNDRSSAQSAFPVVRFSPQMDSLNNVKELQSATNYKTVAYVFAPSNPGGLATGMQAGRASIVNQWVQPSTGDHEPLPWCWDVRCLMVFADDISTDQVGTSASNLAAVLATRAAAELTNHPFTIAVDGEISPKSQYKFGEDYGLGDIIEVQGNSGAVQRARVTEYIRAQDEAGERAYPTVTMFSN